MENNEVATEILETVPDGLFTANCAIMRDETEVGHIYRKLMSISMKGTIEAQGRGFQVFRDGIFNGSFILQTETGEEIAKATRKSFFSNTYIVVFGGNEIVLSRKMFSLRNMYELYQQDNKVGMVSLKRTFSRRILMETAMGIPLEVRIFILYFVMLLISSDNSDNSAATT